MAETAWRAAGGSGSDTVRRLMARPIRMQASQAARQPVAREVPPEPEPAEETHDPGEAALHESDRLRMEMMLVKALLRAERQENAQLRAAAGLDEAGESLGEEARAVRERWASLVDRLLHASA